MKVIASEARYIIVSRPWCGDCEKKGEALSQDI
jgi:hypothetical protein